jgi:hypothetical protein
MHAADKRRMVLIIYKARKRKGSDGRVFPQKKENVTPSGLPPSPKNSTTPNFAPPLRDRLFEVGRIEGKIIYEDHHLAVQPPPREGLDVVVAFGPGG